MILLGKVMLDNNEKFISLMARVLKLNAADISDSTSPDNILSWDSFNGFMIISELETEFNCKFTMEEVFSVKCVSDIRALLVSKYVFT
jgi:acyl carrier protein